jgi:hypothetical protein
MLILLLCLFVSIFAYREESFDVEFIPSLLRISDTCTLYATPSNGTHIRFHDTKKHYNTSEYSPIVAINQDCSLVVFGFPDADRIPENHEASGTGIVKLWRPMESNIAERVAPMRDEISWKDPTYAHQGDTYTKVYRFGFSVDVQNSTWVAGAPGKLDTTDVPTDFKGIPSTIGYAFVYTENELHSCRSLYETGCVPYGTDCREGYKSWKEYYGFLKHGPNSNLDDTEINDFQKKCIPPQLPYYKGGYYGGGPLNPVLIPYFKWQQFGYDVAITGPVEELGTSLFVSAPGDTNRFMENSIHSKGRNYGRVYAWETSGNSPKEKPIKDADGNDTTVTVHWLEPSLTSPLGPPNLRAATYRAYGRSIAASKSLLAVSTYPLYENTHEPFVIIYDCISAKCEESFNRGIAINDIPRNALYYLKPSMLAWSDYTAPIRSDYMIAPDYQNDFIGNDIGVAGSNVIIPNRRHVELREESPTVFRYGKDSRLREPHSYTQTEAKHQNAQYGSNTQHWILGNHKKLTHFWPCELGYTGGKPEEGSTENCSPCSIARVSDDGWLTTCDLCPVNKTTYEPGQSECKDIVPIVYLGFSREAGEYTVGIIIGVGIAMWLIFVAWEYACSTARKPRKF